jgi:pSer/pThr/pTyr-binding forkhead associated (FHA) protein
MPTSDKERPVLIIRDEHQPAEQQPMPKDEITVGRGEECEIVLDNRNISRQHIRIYKEADRYFVQDLDSKNGTWVNNQPLKGRRELQNGDEIRLAATTYVQFIGSGATTPMLSDVSAFTRGRLRLDREARRVFVGDVEIDPPLSLPQYRLLELLFNHAGGICTRDTVVETVWPEAMGEGVSEQAIDALVRRLRDRLNEIDPENQYIITVRGHGFRLENPD